VESLGNSRRRAKWQRRLSPALGNPAKDAGFPPFHRPDDEMSQAQKQTRKNQTKTLDSAAPFIDALPCWLSFRKADFTAQ
jgi:hypothetical protein